MLLEIIKIYLNRITMMRDVRAMFLLFSLPPPLPPTQFYMQNNKVCGSSLHSTAAACLLVKNCSCCVCMALTNTTYTPYVNDAFLIEVM